MKCLYPLCKEQAVCRFCPAHRPEGLPLELERPATGPEAETVDLRPLRANEAPTDDTNTDPRRAA